MNNATEQIFIVNTSDSQPYTAVTKINNGSGSAPDIEDFSTVCRTCATVTEFVIPIFDGEGIQNNLAEKIQKHLPIQVSEQDVLPRVVCYQCASTLLAWHELVQCCVQADAALRSRLSNSSTGNVDSKAEDKEIIPNPTQEQKQKCEIIEETGAQAPASAPPALPTKACAYCPDEIPEQLYKEHLVSLHSDFLFHCDECDAYVDRKEFLLHMSLHAAEYAAKQKIEENKTKRVGRTNENRETRGGRRGRRTVKAEREGYDKPQTDTEGSEKPVNAPANEFSDQSGAEDGFEPLPASVFEAIEEKGEKGEESQPTKKVRVCPLCGKTYTASSSYFYHMKHFHARSREHECATCGKRFGTRAMLAQHLPVHTGARAYACEHCGKRYRSRAALYIHTQSRAHGVQPRWPCSQCDRSFRWRAALARHSARHEQSRPLRCGKCSRRFCVRADLLRHARTHKRQHHACPHCGRDFAQLRYLKVHVGKKHPGADAK